MSSQGICNCELAYEFLVGSETVSPGTKGTVTHIPELSEIYIIFTLNEPVGEVTKIELLSTSLIF